MHYRSFRFGKIIFDERYFSQSPLKKFYKAKEEPGKHEAILGIENLDKVVLVDQSPIGRTPRSNPATYTGAFAYIRDLFSKTKEARIRGFGPAVFLSMSKAAGARPAKARA